MDLVFAPSQIESWPIARLRPYMRNAKMHGDDQVCRTSTTLSARDNHLGRFSGR
jgi:hypothetical protein